MTSAKTLKRNRVSASGGQRIILGIVAAVSVSLALSLLQALIITTEKIQMHQSGIMNYATWLLSAAIGSLIGIRQSDSKKIIKSEIITAGYVLILMLISLTIFCSNLQGILLGIICSILGSLIGCVSKIKKEKHTKHRRR